MIPIIKCKKCGETKEHKAFGLCEKCYNKEWYLSNKEKDLKRRKGWYLNNRKKDLERRKISYHNALGKMRIIQQDKKFYWVYTGGKPVHVVIAEDILGRRFKKGECVHHVDGNGLNNNHNNLIICDASYHQYLHQVQRKRASNDQTT